MNISKCIKETLINLTEHEQNRIMNIIIENEEFILRAKEEYNYSVPYVSQLDKSITTVTEDLTQKEDYMLLQQRYSMFLKRSYYNRHVNDFVNGTYETAGKNIGYKVNIYTKKYRSLFGYNFNHTLSPFYLRRNNKINVQKVKNIINHYELVHDNDDYFFVTVTMPNLEIFTTDLEHQTNELNSILEFANQVLNNLNKKIRKDFYIKGIIKKFECTFSKKNEKIYSHPHYHLLISKRKDNKRILKDTDEEEALSNVIFNYWYENFIIKVFPETKRNHSRAAYDFQIAQKHKLADEIAGYISKGIKEDYLINQTVFDYAYLLFNNKRIITYVGEFKEINKLLKQDVIDDLRQDDNTVLELLENLIEVDAQEFTHYISFTHYKGKGYTYDFIKEIKPELEGFGSGLDNSTSTCKLSRNSSRIT